MQIWLAVVGTILCLVGIAIAVLVWWLALKLESHAVQVQRCTSEIADLQEQFTSGLTSQIDALHRNLNDDGRSRREDFKQLTDRLEFFSKGNSDRLESLLRELGVGVLDLSRSWHLLAVEIKNRYENYDKSEKRAMLQVQAVDTLYKLIQNLGGKAPKRPDENISTPTEADAAAIEELQEVVTRSASRFGGVDEEEPM
jgi:uncharacterized protein YoxC